MNDDILAIVPQPESVKLEGGLFGVKLPLALCGEADFGSEIDVFASQMEAFLPRSVKRGGSAAAGASAINGGVQCVKDASLSGERYKLCIKPDGLTIAAGTGNGIFNGLQTLRQLLITGKKETCFEIPCALIEDAPRFSWRGFMLDCSRHFFQASFIKNLLDALSLHHYNVLHWHITDDQGWRFPVAKYPLLAEKGSVRPVLRLRDGTTEGGVYTAEEIHDIVEYAKRRHIMIVPEVDLPGHTISVLAGYPQLGCTGGPYNVESRHGIFDDILCAGNDEIFPLIEAVFDSLADFFPSRYVHIGGDEAPTTRWESCPKCKARMKALHLDSPRRLQAWLTSRFAAMLSERGKTPIGWDEVLEGADGSPETALPQDLVVMSWRGNKGGVEAVSHGHPVIMTPNTSGCYIDYRHIPDPSEPGQPWGLTTVRSSWDINPIVPEMNAEQSLLVLGGQVNLWSELITADKLAEYMIFPRTSAAAEALWTKTSAKDWESFKRRLQTHTARLSALGLGCYRGPLE